MVAKGFGLVYYTIGVVVLWFHQWTHVVCSSFIQVTQILKNPNEI